MGGTHQTLKQDLKKSQKNSYLNIKKHTSNKKKVLKKSFDKKKKSRAPPLVVPKLLHLKGGHTSNTKFPLNKINTIVQPEIH
jgi:hypothetical protein